MTQAEIRKVIKVWLSNKAPGLDEQTGEFFKTFEDILIQDLHAVITEITSSNLPLEPLNSSYITLIPKSTNPIKPSDYRPISLIHSCQKILSKILANRLQTHMDDLVMKSQSGFIKGRQISEGFIYAREMLQFAKMTKPPLAIFKADIHEAFDTIDWGFLLKIMSALGFPIAWIQWIDRLVLRGKSQVIINGLIGKKIMLKR